MIYFLFYIFVAFVVQIMARGMYILPWFGDKVLVLTAPVSSFLWPIGLVMHILTDWFGLGLVEDEEDEDKK